MRHKYLISWRTRLQVRLGTFHLYLSTLNPHTWTLSSVASANMGRLGRNQQRFWPGQAFVHDFPSLELVLASRWKRDANSSHDSLSWILLLHPWPLVVRSPSHHITPFITGRGPPCMMCLPRFFSKPTSCFRAVMAPLSQWGISRYFHMSYVPFLFITGSYSTPCWQDLRCSYPFLPGFLKKHHLERGSNSW